MSSPAAPSPSAPADGGSESENEKAPAEQQDKQTTMGQRRAARRKRANNALLMRGARKSQTFANLKSHSKASGRRARATRTRIQSINRNSALGPVRKVSR